MLEKGLSLEENELQKKQMQLHINRYVSAHFLRAYLYNENTLDNENTLNSVDRGSLKSLRDFYEKARSSEFLMTDKGALFLKKIPHWDFVIEFGDVSDVAYILDEVKEAIATLEKYTNKNDYNIAVKYLEGNRTNDNKGLYEVNNTLKSIASSLKGIDQSLQDGETDDKDYYGRRARKQRENKMKQELVAYASEAFKKIIIFINNTEAKSEK